MERINGLVDKYQAKVEEYWHWLHAHPELSGQEEKSAEYIAAALREMGLEPIERIGGYGVVALIEGAKPGKCVGLRADFDALPVIELTGSEYASQNPGVCHACGHDAHAAMLLGAAHILNEMKDELSGTVKLIFQPSEENPDISGARAMIADGVLENPKVDAVIGQHVNPNIPTGNIKLGAGVRTAALDQFSITIYGKGAHASSPHKSVDAIVVGAQVIIALQSIVSRNVNPLDSAVLGIGKLNAGTVENVVASTCTMSGTCRNLSSQVRDEIIIKMESIIKGIAEGMGASYEFNYIKGYPPVVNDVAMNDIINDAAVEILGKEHVGAIETPALGGEDFAFYCEKVPGLIYRLGCAKEGAEFWPVHNGHFYPDEKALPVGVKVMVASALKFLAQE